MRTDLSLTICGQGAVGPFGSGVDALISGSVSKKVEKPIGKTAVTRSFTTTLPADRVAHWQNQSRLRRVSSITLSMMEAGWQACQNLSDEERQSVGIVAAHFTGCLGYSRRFFSEIIESGQRFASPILFPETVFNSPTSHVASVLGTSGPCYSVVGDNAAWVSAMSVAACWLKNGLVRNVLVIGAEELEAVSLEAYSRAGWFRRNSKFTASEGAGAVLLRLAQPSDPIQIEALIEGLSYRNPAQARAAAAECLEAFLPTTKTALIPALLPEGEGEFSSPQGRGPR
jgi:3-oxoacyl-(acyl-carrier-protein) synthase